MTCPKSPRISEVCNVSVAQTIHSQTREASTQGRLHTQRRILYVGRFLAHRSPTFGRAVGELRNTLYSDWYVAPEVVEVTMTDEDKANARAQHAQQGPLTEEQLRAAHVTGLAPLTQPIEIAEYDPAWPTLFVREAARVRAMLGERVVRLEHVGSTSVPDLAAKPRIDMLLVVADTADEGAYVPALEAAGYVLHIREPDWYEHRLFKGPDTDINLHVFSVGCEETDRVLLFRDWLRTHPADRQLYERTKRELAQRDWTYLQHYADAKTAVVAEIMQRTQS